MDKFDKKIHSLKLATLDYKELKKLVRWIDQLKKENKLLNEKLNEIIKILV